MSLPAAAARQVDLDAFTWAEWADDPYPLYRRLRDERPVYWDERNRTVVLTRYDDVLAVLGDHGRFSSVPPEVHAGRVARFSPLRENDPPEHRLLRSVVLPLFTPRAMRRRAPALRALCEELCDTAEQDDVVEASTAFGAPLPGRVTLDVLGLPVADHARFHTLTHERYRLLMQKDGRIAPLEDARPIDQVTADMWTIVRPVLEARRREPQDDAISLLAAAQPELGAVLSDDTFLDMLLHLLTGGFETTQHLIELLVDHLADREELWRELGADRSLVPVAIEEMLRWQSPVQALPRRATGDVEIRGVAVPGNTRVTVVYGSANRDERAFDDPDTFRLDRDLKRHVAFSFGIHYCVGAPVSRYEVAALLDVMLDRYRRIERAGPSEPMPDASPRLTVGKMRGFGRVPVRLLA